jgi:hypothetical protein
MLSDPRSCESEPAADLESRLERGLVRYGVTFSGRAQRFAVRFQPASGTAKAASRKLGSRKNFFEGGY